MGEIVVGSVGWFEGDDSTTLIPLEPIQCEMSACLSSEMVSMVTIESEDASEDGLLDSPVEHGRCPAVVVSYAFLGSTICFLAQGEGRNGWEGTREWRLPSQRWPDKIPLAEQSGSAVTRCCSIATLPVMWSASQHLASIPPLHFECLLPSSALALGTPRPH